MFREKRAVGLCSVVGPGGQLDWRTDVWKVFPRAPPPHPQFDSIGALGLEWLMYLPTFLLLPLPGTVIRFAHHGSDEAKPFTMLVTVSGCFPWSTCFDRSLMINLLYFRYDMGDGSVHQNFDKSDNADAIALFGDS